MQNNANTTQNNKFDLYIYIYIYKYTFSLNEVTHECFLYVNCFRLWQLCIVLGSTYVRYDISYTIATCIYRRRFVCEDSFENDIPSVYCLALVNRGESSMTSPSTNHMCRASGKLYTYYILYIYATFDSVRRRQICARENLVSAVVILCARFSRALTVRLHNVFRNLVWWKVERV